MSRVSSRSVVFALVVGVVVGGAVFAAVGVDGATDSPMVSDVDAEPVVIDVSPERVQSTASVTFQVRSAPGAEVTSNTSGLLTRVAIRAGETMRSGSTLAEANDRPIIGMVSDRPLYRSLAVGDHGPDVLALERFLRDLELGDGEPDDYFGSDTAAAVNEFNDRYHQPDPSGAFDLASIAWLGPRPLRAAKVAGRPGEQTSPGQLLATGPPTPVSIAVTEPDTGLSRVHGGYTLQVGETAVRYRAGSGMITDHRAVADLANAASAAGEGFADAVSVRGERVIRVPASAVVVGSGGDLCVFESADGPPIAVDPIRGRLSAVDLPATSDLRRVLVNPAQVRASAGCD